MTVLKVLTSRNLRKKISEKKIKGFWVSFVLWVVIDRIIHRMKLFRIIN